MKKKEKIITGIMLAGVLTSCSQSTQTEDISSTNTQTTSQENIDNTSDLAQSVAQSSSSSNQDTLADTSSTTEQLQISSKCRGCGRCARIASSNITMSGRQAIVFSQEDIGSSSVSQAISACPVGAISIS